MPAVSIPQDVAFVTCLTNSNVIKDPHSHTLSTAGICSGLALSFSSRSTICGKPALLQALQHLPTGSCSASRQMAIVCYKT